MRRKHEMEVERGNSRQEGGRWLWIVIVREPNIIIDFAAKSLPKKDHKTNCVCSYFISFHMILEYNKGKLQYFINIVNTIFQNKLV